MSHYVLLLKYHSEGLRKISQNPEFLHDVHAAIERWEARVLHSFHLLGEWDQCVIIDAPDNFKAYRAALAQELSTTSRTRILPAIDLPLFQRLISQSARTAGPHPWQTQAWARLVRRIMFEYAYGRWARRYFTRHEISGQSWFDDIKPPCLIVANHASHFDQYCLMPAVPERIRSNLFFGAAADRWFLKGRRELTLQPWYQSLVMGLYPIQRGGGSKTLAYPGWLLDQGANLMLFPEGTRSRGAGLARFKHGVALLALQKQVPVVPIYMTGLKRIRPPGARKANPGPVAAHVLEPLRFTPDTPVPDATAALFRAMNAVHQRVLAHGDQAAFADWRQAA